jgi:hypothetical protein
MVCCFFFLWAHEMHSFFMTVIFTARRLQDLGRQPEEIKPDADPIGSG